MSSTTGFRYCGGGLVSHTEVAHCLVMIHFVTGCYIAVVIHILEEGLCFDSDSYWGGRSQDDDSCCSDVLVIISKMVF